MKTILIYLFMFSGFTVSDPGRPVCTAIAARSYAETYICTPCGNDCDQMEYTEPGLCPYCHMPLIIKALLNFKTIAPSDVCAYISSHKEVVLLDVRTKEEFLGKTDRYGTLKNAINIPVQELESRLPSLRGLRNKEILVYCSHSRRSPQASYILSQHGFAHVINMSGGISTMEDNSCKK